MARIRFLWVQELPPDQTGQEEAVNGHGHHLGKTPGDTPEELQFPASLFRSTPHVSKRQLRGCRLSGLLEALGLVMTGLSACCRKVQKALDTSFAL